MKLTKDLKEKIDNYFDNISAEELFKISILKYDFAEITFELENEGFSTIEKSFYPSNNFNITLPGSNEDLIDLSSAA